MSRYPLKLRVKDLHTTDTCFLPKAATRYSDGMDIFLPKSGSDSYTIPQGSVVKIPLGYAIELPEGYKGVMRSRSSIFLQGVLIEGLIDEDYRGEVSLMVCNMSKEDKIFKPGQKIAQMSIERSCRFESEWVDEDLSVTERGTGGFGSTGEA